MPVVLPEVSRTFSEYLLLPNLTGRECIPANVTLRAPLSASGRRTLRHCHSTCRWCRP